MKLRITTILSLAGVLSAGSAAALVNNQVLTSTETNSTSGVRIDAGGTTNDVAADSATRIYASALTATQVMYQVGNAGVVTLDTAGNVLTVVSATASPGWVVVKTESQGSAIAEVKLQSADAVVEFTATRLADGSLATNVESTRASDDTATTTGHSETTVNSTDHRDVNSVDDANGNAVDDNGDVNSGHGNVDACDDVGSVSVCVVTEVNDD